MKANLENWCHLETIHGKFRMYDLQDEQVRLISVGDVTQQSDKPLLRIHSSCLASEVFGALDCDCADQLRESLKRISHEGYGLIVHLQQEGRGHGLSKKIKAVSTMHNNGIDTVQAFERLNLKQDIRDYSVVVELLKQLGVNCVRLISNNPRKKTYLEDHDIKVVSINTYPSIRPQNKSYLHSKNQKLGHTIPLAKIDTDNSNITFYHSDQAWGFLSNFSAHAIYIKGRVWPTVEHFYQSQKFVGSLNEELIRCSLSPMLAKLLAGEIAMKNAPEKWSSRKESIMTQGLRAKFTQHPDLREKLLNTKDHQLIEHTKTDPYWGDAGDGTGQNRLGHLLMQVRSELKSLLAVS